MSSEELVQLTIRRRFILVGALFSWRVGLISGETMNALAERQQLNRSLLWANCDVATNLNSRGVWSTLVPYGGYLMIIETGAQSFSFILGLPPGHVDLELIPSHSFNAGTQIGIHTNNPDVRIEQQVYF